MFGDALLGITCAAGISILGIAAVPPVGLAVAALIAVFWGGKMR